jgi:hypothetical protein
MSRRVLLVEDDARASWVLTLALEDEGYQVDLAATADGGAGPIGLGLGALICLVFSIAVYYLGVALRLPPERAADYIAHTPAGLSD